MMLAGASAAVGDVVPGVMALAGIALTGLLLVADLKRPERFHFLFTRLQWRSWLALGAQAINLAALVALAFTVASLLGAGGASDALRIALVPAGALLAGYTALLFNQCEGRDLWQSPLLLAHTLVNAIAAGAGALAIAALVTGDGRGVLRLALVASCAASALLVAQDTWGHHPTAQAARAARNLWRDRFERRFWAGVGLGLLAPLPLALVGGAVPLAVAGALALVGLWLYEDAWVRAGQSVPLS
jgi:formate-dependent nitrite reductase membrane component NrfD